MLLLDLGKCITLDNIMPGYRKGIDHYMGGILITIVLIVLLMNAVLLVFKLRRNPLRKSSRHYKAPEELEGSIVREKRINLMLEQEHENAIRQVELRNKTLELYDEVRRKAAAAEARAGTDPYRESDA